MGLPVRINLPRWLPVASLLDARGALPHKHVARLQFMDAVPYRPGRRHVSKRHYVCKSHWFECRPGFKQGQQSSRFRGHHQAPRRHRIVQWLDAKAVACRQNSAPTFVPQDKGEHPLQLFHRPVPPRLVGVKNHFVVAVRQERVSGPLQTRTKIGIVVDLAVAHEPDCLVLVVHRLAACVAQVHDRQAPMTKPHTAVAGTPLAGSVRPPMYQCTQSGCLRGRIVSPVPYHRDDTAHC